MISDSIMTEPSSAFAPHQPCHETLESGNAMLERVETRCGQDLPTALLSEH